ncbi:MAG: beta/gamma crystallin family protein [Burkholderiales bacterium]|nr:beta/gamma crystallin family protein [Burkholderiales bacterium]MCC6377370.1 beta/gamma crystallin family protein [Burkholderiales bacterium]
MKTTFAAGLAAGLAALSVAGASSAQIALYENEGFSGRNYSSSHSVSNLADSGFNDRASSAIVRGGRWQICADAYFAGRCTTLGPGEYPSLEAMGLSNRVSSVRSLGWTPDGGGGWNNQPQWGGGGGNWGSGSRAILYSGYSLSGETLVVEPGGMSNLDRRGFNDKARSLRVESGYWIFCTDANFQGDCHTYGPGDYPNLPMGQSHAISSGRRVSGNYPYRNNPNWGY